MTTAFWFRRDLRVADHPMLLASLQSGPVLPFFLADRNLLHKAGARRRSYLRGSLECLDRQIRGLGGGGLAVWPRTLSELAELFAANGIGVVAATHDFSPYGLRRDRRAWSTFRRVGISLRVGDSPYLHPPGSVLKPDGQPYRVFTPFHRAWADLPSAGPAPRPLGWEPATDQPVATAEAADWEQIGPPPQPDGPPPGEAAGLQRWRAFLATDLAGYAANRDRPEPSQTSRLSAALRFGEIHPRTILAESAGRPGAAAFTRQLAWRDFYAAILHDRPDSAHANYARSFDAMRWDSGPDSDRSFDAWSRGMTGYPFVDAGMRELLATGFMHNRARMVTASFLIKDLHLDWRRGAAWFMHHLIDADIANNQHGWQWTAGSGTDAAPFHRIFNPVLQGERFDPQGDYVARWVPELRHLRGAERHQPWRSPEGYRNGYPQRLVDHAVERRVAMARLAEITSAAKRSP